MSSVLLRSGEDVSSYAIGQFGDQRLAKTGALFFKRLQEKLTVCVKSLGGDRATEVAFSRFLGNENVEPTAISDELSNKTNDTCLGKSHVFSATVTKVMRAGNNGKIIVWGKGQEKRDLLYIDDLVEFVRSAIKNRKLLLKYSMPVAAGQYR